MAPSPPVFDEETTRALKDAHDLVENMRRQQSHASEGGSPAPPAHLLGAFTQEDVLRAAGDEADTSLRWLAAEWHARKDTVVALGFQPLEFGAPLELLDPRLMVLQKRAGKLGLVAKTKLGVRRAECANESGEPAGGSDRAPDWVLDLAPYTIAPGQTAIGVRFTCANTYPAAEGLETRLMLFALQHGTLRQVFDEKIAGINYDRLSANTSTTTGVVSVQRQQHAGHFDLELRRRTKTEGSDPQAFPQTARQPSESTQTTSFVWNGELYQAAKGQ